MELTYWKQLGNGEFDQASPSSLARSLLHKSFKLLDSLPPFLIFSD
jgi:hypothetical protein